MEIDTSDLDRLAMEAAMGVEEFRREVPRVMRKAGVNIKNEWNAHAARSRHFRIAGTVNFDERSAFASYEVEVGPDRRRRAARLAGIAHFGGANGGGGTLQNPDVYLDREAPRMEQAIGDLIDKVLG